MFSRFSPYRVLRYLESKLLLQRLSLDSLADVEALPQSWGRILERYKEDVVQGSCGYKGTRGLSQGSLLETGLRPRLCWSQQIAQLVFVSCSEILVSFS